MGWKRRAGLGLSEAVSRTREFGCAPASAPFVDVTAAVRSANHLPRLLLAPAPNYLRRRSG
jgi:hypothetical protein